MKTFNSSEKGYNKQCATAYIVYMMAGSYFSSSGVTRKFPNLYLHYAEMPREKQYQCESRVISSMEVLGEGFLQRIADLHCDVRCRSCGDDLLMEFYTGGFEGLQCRIQKNGTFCFTPFQGCEQVVPIEVKAEVNLKAKSLKTYREKFNPEISVRTSMADYKKEERLVNLPLYAVEEICK